MSILQAGPLFLEFNLCEDTFYLLNDSKKRHIVVQCFPVCHCFWCKEVQCLTIHKNNLRMLLQLDFSITKICRLHVNYYEEQNVMHRFHFSHLSLVFRILSSVPVLFCSSTLCRYLAALSISKSLKSSRSSAVNLAKRNTVHFQTHDEIPIKTLVNGVMLHGEYCVYLPDLRN